MKANVLTTSGSSHRRCPGSDTPWSQTTSRVMGWNPAGSDPRPRTDAAVRGGPRPIAGHESWFWKTQGYRRLRFHTWSVGETRVGVETRGNVHGDYAQSR